MRSHVRSKDTRMGDYSKQGQTPFHCARNCLKFSSARFKIRSPAVEIFILGTLIGLISFHTLLILETNIFSYPVGNVVHLDRCFPKRGAVEPIVQNLAQLYIPNVI